MKPNQIKEANYKSVLINYKKKIKQKLNEAPETRREGQAREAESNGRKGMVINITKTTKLNHKKKERSVKERRVCLKN